MDLNFNKTFSSFVTPFLVEILQPLFMLQGACAAFRAQSIGNHAAKRLKPVLVDEPGALTVSFLDLFSNIPNSHSELATFFLRPPCASVYTWRK